MFPLNPSALRMKDTGGIDRIHRIELPDTDIAEIQSFATGAYPKLRPGDQIQLSSGESTVYRRVLRVEPISGGGVLIWLDPGPLCYGILGKSLEELPIALIRVSEARHVISNPYQRYAESNLLSATPLQLVVMLYEFAYEKVHAACAFTRSGDPAARGNAVNKALEALMELTASLDPAVGLTGQLRELYAYMQNRLIEGHMEQSEEKLQEVAGLLKTMTEAWRKASETSQVQTYNSGPELPGSVVTAPPAAAISVAYGRF